MRKRRPDPAQSAEQESRLADELRAEQRPLTGRQRDDLAALLAADYGTHGARMEISGDAPVAIRERCACCGKMLAGGMALLVRSFWIRSACLARAAGKKAA